MLPSHTSRLLRSALHETTEDPSTLELACSYRDRIPSLAMAFRPGADGCSSTLWRSEVGFATAGQGLRLPDKDHSRREPQVDVGYLFTKSASLAAAASEGLEAGVGGINQTSVHEPETPFGGVNESGYGSESGSEGLDAYLRTKMVAQRH